MCKNLLPPESCISKLCCPITKSYGQIANTKYSLVKTTVYILNLVVGGSVEQVARKVISRQHQQTGQISFNCTLLPCMSILPF